MQDHIPKRKREQKMDRKQDMVDHQNMMRKSMKINMKKTSMKRTGRGK